MIIVSKTIMKCSMFKTNIGTCTNVLISALLISVSLAAPQNSNNAFTVNYANNNDGLGDYSFSFHTSDGTMHQETGQVINRGAENQFIVVKGSYTFVAPDGNKYFVEYIADENGYRTTRSQITFAKKQGPYTTTPAPIPPVSYAFSSPVIEEGKQAPGSSSLGADVLGSLIGGMG